MIKVGFFDSGHGGLSLLKSCQKLLPHIEFHYIADSSHHPYGPKSESDVKKRCLVLTEQLIKRGCSIIVVACNTATAVSIDILREKFKDHQFVGIEPYLNAISKEGLSDHRKVGAIVTPRTYDSQRFNDLRKRVDPKRELDIVATPGLASLIEKSIINKSVLCGEQLKLVLKNILKKDWDHLILGCTHYPLIQKSLSELLNLKCIDPSNQVALRLKSLLKTESISKINDPSFYYHSTDCDLWERKVMSDFFLH